MVAQTTVAEALPGTVTVPVGDLVALVDEADYDLVSEYVWRPMYAENGRIYAHTHAPGKHGSSLIMHRLVAGTPAGLDTDHVNGDGLDNRRVNLRTATRSQNLVNAPKRQRYAGRPCSSIYKGVHLDRRSGHWRASITIGGRTKSLGSYASEVDAALAYDRAALAQWGKRVQINFPDRATSDGFDASLAVECGPRVIVDLLCDSEDLLSLLVAAVGELKASFGTARVEGCEARVLSLIDDLAGDRGISVIAS